MVVVVVVVVWCGGDCALSLCLSFTFFLSFSLIGVIIVMVKERREEEEDK